MTEVATEKHISSTPGRRRSDDYTEDMHLAHVICDTVDAYTMDRFVAMDISVELKGDLTVVTEADRTAEDMIRAHLRRARTRDAVQGEERDDTGDASRCWVIDPIDGTANFARGIPVWATLIALVVDGKPVLGMVSAPALNKRWWAISGHGAFVGRSMAAATRLQVSEHQKLDQAMLSISSAVRWESVGLLTEVLDLHRNVQRVRGFGEFWSHMLVAEGVCDIALDTGQQFYDLAALMPIVQEAGGRMTNLAGEESFQGPHVVTTNDLLHDEVLTMLGQATP